MDFKFVYHTLSGDILDYDTKELIDKVDFAFSKESISKLYKILQHEHINDNNQNLILDSVVIDKSDLNKLCRGQTGWMDSVKKTAYELSSPTKNKPHFRVFLRAVILTSTDYIAQIEFVILNCTLDFNIKSVYTTDTDACIENVRLTILPSVIPCDTKPRIKE